MKKLLCIFLFSFLCAIPALGTDVVVSSAVSTNIPFNPANIGNDQSIAVSVTNGSTAVTSASLFPQTIVGRSGFQVSIGGTQYTVAGVASRSSLTLTTAYGGSTGSATMTLYKFVLLRIYSDQSFSTYASSPTSVTVSVTNGSATVTSATLFPSAYIGAVGTFPVLINNVRYQVYYVTSTSSLTLTTPYLGSTGSTTLAFNSVQDVVQAGAVGSASWYKEIGVSVINPGAGNSLYYPAFVLPSTTDAPVNNTARYSLAFYNASGGYLNAIYTCDGGVTQLALPPTTPTTFPNWCSYSGATAILPDSSTYTRQQIDARFPACTSGQSYYFAANGNIVSCLNFGSGLTLTGNTLTASGGGGGSGTVTSFSSGNLSPLFTTSVATATTTPALTFSLSSQAANTVFAGPTSGGSAAPTFRALVLADLPASITLTATQVSSNYTALTTDWTISMDTSGGNRTVTLYAASNTGKLLSVCKATTDGNTVTISDGTLSEVIYSPATCMQFLATGSVWKVQSY